MERSRIATGISLVDLLADATDIFPSKGELRKTVKAGGVSLNKEKVADAEQTVGEDDLLSDRYLLAQKGKKSYYLIIVE